MSSRSTGLRFHSGMVNEGAGICGEAAHGTSLKSTRLLAQRTHDEAV